MLVDKYLNDVQPPYVAADGTQHPRAIEELWSDAELAALGWYRLNLDDRPEGLVIAERGPREWRGDPQEAWQTWVATPIPATREAVNGERNRRIAEGFTATLDDGRRIPVDMRNLEDQVNIAGMRDVASEIAASGSTAELVFGDAADVEHAVTAEQMMAIARAAAVHKDRIWKAARSLKAQIAAGTLANAADIPAAFDAILRPAP